MRVVRLAVRGLALVVTLGVLGAAAARAYEGTTDQEEEDFRLLALFGGRQVASRNPAVTASTAVAAFGGIALDLTEARLGPDAMVRLRAYLGGIRVVVPATWNVVVTSDVKAGEVETNLPDEIDPDAPTLRIDATVRCGGILLTTAD